MEVHLTSNQARASSSLARSALGHMTKKVKYACECIPCKLCGEPWCADCGDHYADCECPGPHSEGVVEVDGELVVLEEPA